MPRVIVDLHHQNITVSRPIAKSVVTELLYLLQYSSIRDILYVARGRHAETKQTENPLEANKLSTDEYLEVQYEEKFIDEYRNPDQYQFEFPPIFAIPELGISVRPFAQRCSLELTINYISRSYTTIMSWQNAVKRFLLIRNSFYYHDLYYNYTIPYEILAYIKQVYDLTESVAPYHRTLKTFIQTYFAKDAIAVRQNIDDSQRALSVQVKNIGCLGQMTQLPDSNDTGKDPPKTESSITYVVEFDLPTALILDYQHYIHNQKIDLKFLRHCQSRTYTNDLHPGLKAFSGSVNTVADKPHVPLTDSFYTEDGWTIKSSYPTYYTYLILPIKLNPLDLKAVLNVNDLLHYGFPQPILNLLTQFKDYLVKLNKWFLYMDLIEVGTKETKIALEVDILFNVRTKFDLDLRKRHYFVLYLNTDLANIDWKFFQTFVTEMTQLLTFFYPTLDVANLIKTVGDPLGYQIISLDSIDTVINTLRSKRLLLKPANITYTRHTNYHFTKNSAIRTYYD